MKRVLALATATALALLAPATAARADTESDQAAAAAIAILGIAALAHNKHHYQTGYAPVSGDATAAFERGYRDGLYGHSYDSRHGGRDYSEGYQSGQVERENASTYRHRPEAVTGNGVPHEATKACVKIVAQNFAVSGHNVHIVNSYQKATHQYVIEAAVGRQTMVCTAKDNGEILDLRGRG